MGNLINIEHYRGRITECKTLGELVRNLMLSIDANFYNQSAATEDARIKAEQSMAKLQRIDLRVKKLK